ncbi:NAD-binding protein [Propionivibrio sp.]|uniref:NAD-binding protein n=1 Tax=Propionivibrio sp. TaxID=2212460 RepID=UPI0025E2FB41|nr:NAD-binding protein [Propionivibrio sp.]
MQSAPRLLPAFPEKLAAIAQRSLEQLGVDVRIGSRVENIDADGVTVSGERIPAKAAVADFGFIRLWGAPAWWLWGFVHVGFLVGVRNRVATMVNWFWSYLTFGGGIRLITGGDTRPVAEKAVKPLGDGTATTQLLLLIFPQLMTTALII